jgi:DNA mismatch repair protein MutL
LYKNKDNSSTEQLLFPHVIKIDKTPKSLLQNIVENLADFGFIVEIKNDDNLSIKGIPTNMVNRKQLFQVLESIVVDLLDGIEMDFSFVEKFALKLAEANSFNRGVRITKEEMNYLVDELFKCTNPYSDPNGKKCFIKIEMDEIIKRFS